jgi:hypothetical protein
MCPAIADFEVAANVRSDGLHYGITEGGRTAAKGRSLHTTDFDGLENIELRRHCLVTATAAAPPSSQPAPASEPHPVKSGVAP